MTAIKTRPTAPRTSRPKPTCPTHKGAELEGGPVQYRCPRGHRVQSADIDNTYRPIGGAA